MTPPSKVSRKWAKKKNKTLFQQIVKENHLDEFLDEFLDEILDEFFFLNLIWKLLSLFPTRQRKLEFSTTPPSKVLRKWAKKENFLNKKWTKSSCCCKVQKGSLLMQSSKKALGWILGQKPGWILFFLNLVWELLKVVFNASKKIRTFYDASFKSFEKVSQKTKHFFNKKSKKTTWMNSWMESWMNFVFF